MSGAQLCPMTSHPRTQAEGEAIWNLLSSRKSEKSERAGENLEWPLQLLLQHIWPPHRYRATISGREVDATPRKHCGHGLEHQRLGWTASRKVEWRAKSTNTICRKDPRREDPYRQGSGWSACPPMGRPGTSWELHMCCSDVQMMNG